MSLAAQFGFETQPKVPVNRDTTPLTSLAVRIRARAQAQLQAQAQTQAQAQAQTQTPNPSDSESEFRRSPDGSHRFMLYADTASAMRACVSGLVSKRFQFAKLGENRLLVVLDSNDQIGFQLSIESLEDSACTSVVKFSLPSAYGSVSIGNPSFWSARLKELNCAIVFSLA